MRSDISPNRISISDRYPMLGFTIRSHGTPQLAEVTLATDPALFRNPEKRSPDNFFSTASMGPLQIMDGEAVYIVPAEVLARFVGKEKLYFALATRPADQSTGYQIQVMPDDDSVYITLTGLTGRSLRRVRMFPNRGHQVPGYGSNGQAGLTWAGDTAQPRTDEVSAPQNGRAGQNGQNGQAPKASDGQNGNGASAAKPAPYNDGFGDLPPLPDETSPATRAAPEQDADTDDDDIAEDEEISQEEEAEVRAEEETAPEDAAIAASLGATQPAVRDVQIGEKVAAQAPETSTMGTAMELALDAAILANPPLAATVAAIRLANDQGLSVGLGIAVSGGFAAGGALGAGVIFAPGNKLGVYGVGELDLGAIFSVSGTFQMTVLNGGISAFEGITYVAGFSAGEGIVGGGAAIFDSSNEFIGVSVEIGLGVGSPLDVYAGVQRGVAQSLGFAAAFGANPVLAQPMLRDSTADARRYAPRWRHLLRWRAPSAIRAEVRRRGFSIQTFASARGDLNLDLLEVKVSRLPSGQSAEDLIRHIRINMARFVNPSLTRFDFFSPADGTKWSGSSPEGTMFNLRIPGDNAAVVASKVEPRKWRFTTIETPATGTHPVSGHREFGIRETDDNGYIIYTRGADRFTYPSAMGALETPAFAVAERLWRSFQEKVADHVNRNGGSARVLTPFRRHFSWRDATRALASSGRSGAGTQALGANSDPYTLELKYRMFIPSPAITGPFSDDYGGDGRGFSYDQGSSRGEIVASVKLTRGMGIERLRVVRRHWGESTAYDSDDTYAVSGKPDWWLGRRSGATPTERKTLRATDDNLNVEIGTSGRWAVQAVLENASVVSVKAEGAMPLSRVAPDIDADVAVFIRMHNGQIQVKAGGRHDGFPCHELYVNGRSIYRYDPVAAGNGPSSLAGWGDTEVNTRWVTVARPGSSAQALGINESFTINWDDLDKVAQPTNTSCWAAAAAMVVGWRDKISLSPATVAEIAGRPIKQGLNPDNVQDLAEALNLTAVAGQSFTADGFRTLLENNGPLWVGVALPGSLHAVVVTGMYNDEDGDLMVRITDPWDRIVGTPGSPGSHKSTHRTGSRYIMTWPRFQQEYELMGASTTGRSFQILHAGGHHGHTPNRGTPAPPPGYAAGLSDQTAGAPPAVEPPANPGVPAKMAVTISEEAAPLAPATVIPVSGPNGVPTEARWATAITDVLGADHVQSLAGLPALAAARGWTVAIGPDTPQSHGAPGVGVAPGGTIFRYGGDPAAAAASTNGAEKKLLVTIAEGEPQLFTQWTKARSFATDTQVTGAVLLDATDMPLALAMRLGAGAALPQQIEAVSAAVTAAFVPSPSAAPVPAPAKTPVVPEAAPAPAPAPVSDAAPQHPGNGHGNGDAATPAATIPPAAASALAAMMQAGAGAPAPTPQNGAMPPLPGQPVPPPIEPPITSPQPHPDGDFPPPGVTIHRSDVERNGVSYALFLMDGTVYPDMPPAVAQPLIPGQQVVLDDWPYLDGASGKSKGGVVLDWSYGGGAVGNVRTAPGSPAAHDGWAIAVTTDVGPGPSDSDETKLRVTVRTVFTKQGEQTRTGVCHVILCGSGKHEVSHADESVNPQPAMA